MRMTQSKDARAVRSAIGAIEAFLGRHWFLAALAVLIVLAGVWPEEPAGFLHRHNVLDYLIAAVFLNSGLCIRTDRLLAGIGDFRSFLLIQGITFIVFPLLMAATAMPIFSEPADLKAGFALLLAVPTTITSCVILTTIAGGSTAVALVSAVAGNLLGVVVTPLLLKIALQVEAAIPVLPMIQKLALIVLLPVIAGQCLRPLRPALFDSWKKGFSKFNQCVVLAIVYVSAARAVPALNGGAALIGGMAAYMIVFHVAMLWLSRLAGRLRGGPAELGPAIMFCSAQKTMAIGQALAGNVAAALGGQAALIMAPLIVYHIAQLTIDAALAQRMGVRAKRG